MANLNRPDRQLMRQRGAGSRNINNIDFGLNIGSQGSREDRQLMRQRGAGNRKVGNVDFGFSFPTPSQSRHSSRTPQTVRRSVERASKTPVSVRERHPSAPRSVRAGHVESLSNQQRSSKTPQPTFQTEQPNSGKRRKLNKDDPKLISNGLISNIPPLPQPLLHNPEFAVLEHHKLDAGKGKGNVIDSNSAELSDDEVEPESPLFVPEDNDKENAWVESDQTNSTAARTKRNSKLSRFDSVERLGTQDVAPDFIIRSIEDIEADQAIQERDEENDFETHKQSIVNLSESVKPVSDSTIKLAEAVAQKSIGSTKRRKKRKSVVLGRRKRRSSEGVRISISQAGQEDTMHSEPSGTRSGDELGFSAEQSAASDEGTEPERSIQESLPIWKKLAARGANGRRNRLSVSASPAPRGREDDEDDETYIDDNATPDPPTPAPKTKKPAGRTRKRASDASTKVERGSKVVRKSFPIVTHRMTNTQALPTILEEDENSNLSDVDGDRLPAAFSTRTQPNAIDVLAQVCRESIQSTIEKLQTSSATQSRAEVKHKRTALEAFGESLEQRLFDMSEAVEHRVTMEARLRKSKREKAELQARWIEVRRQRDELALRADTIRRQNWENEEESKRQWQISELAYKTELEVDRDGSDNEDLEFILKQAAGNVSGMGGQGGILDRVKSFNSQLEVMAATLEGR